MVFIKKIDLSLICFFSKKSKKETFLDILDRKECVLDLKSEVLAKSRKNRHFAKGLVHGFSQQIGDFFISFFFFEPRKPERNIF